MKNIKRTHSLLAVVLGSVLMSSSVLAAEVPSGKAPESTGQKIGKTIDEAGKKVDDSLQKADNYLDDSSITAKVKGKLLEHKGINSNDISVKTEKGVVYLSGFVGSKKEAVKVAEIAHGVKGVKSVKNSLTVKK
ncbi:BON domain-containing protein [Xenorhabdus sp. 12]|uniref:BON domain-containing protein n=1 Tax=Xenorhabdus santafensis TaxID=2582833 RepID=A0ABU4S3J8_9GAMM|nr:BON domain-containing protein [Xenorhabdus sp. 12]MDX7985807.1 BON domain-containing protein [Xenorhabdus sp. 12]